MFGISDERSTGACQTRKGRITRLKLPETYVTLKRVGAIYCGGTDCHGAYSKVAVILGEVSLERAREAHIGTDVLGYA